MSVRTVLDPIALSTGAFLSTPLEQQLVAEGEIPPSPRCSLPFLLPSHPPPSPPSFPARDKKGEYTASRATSYLYEKGQK